MLAKLRLNVTAEYEQWLAVLEISGMLLSFVEKRKHILSIGAEQGDVKAWDDFIVEKEENLFVHWQIKRQNTDFLPTGKCKKNIDQELTPLDNSMASLASWIQLPPDPLNTNSHKFCLLIPSDNPSIKKDLQLREFREFMRLHIRQATTVNGLYDLQNIQQDTATVKVFDWLTTWCEFNDWKEILKALSILEIRECKLETDIEAEALSNLAKIFKDPPLVLKLLKQYTLDNSAYTASISPRQLLAELNNYLLDTHATWTSIQSKSSDWTISGIHDLKDYGEIERPSKIVPLLWSNDRPRNLLLDIPYNEQPLTSMHKVIFQLALHARSPVLTFCHDWNRWKISLGYATGKTLGASEEDFDNIHVADNADKLTVTDVRNIKSASDQKLFVDELGSEMLKKTWHLVKDKVGDKITGMNITSSAELQDAVRDRWTKWKTQLDSNHSVLQNLLCSMLHPKIEGADIYGSLRLGPLNKLTLAEAIFTSLIVSVALNDGTGDIMKTDTGLTIGAIAIGWWSGPHGHPRRVRKIDAPDSVDQLIAEEKYGVLIISESAQAESELLKTPLSNTVGDDTSMAAGSKPYIIVTRNNSLEQKINEGNLEGISEYFRNKIKDRSQAIEKALKNAAL